MACWVVQANLVEAQSIAHVRAEENFRRDPNGELLAVLNPGVPLNVLSSGDGWVEVVVEGWVWARSLQVADREGMDLVVSEAEGENLRDGPSGTILGRLERGTLLEEIERQPGWIHVRRHGWIWEASVMLAAPEPGPAEVEPAEQQGPAARGDSPPPLPVAPSSSTVPTGIPWP